MKPVSYLLYFLREAIREDKSNSGRGRGGAGLHKRREVLIVNLKLIGNDYQKRKVTIHEKMLNRCTGKPAHLLQGRDLKV